MTGAHNVMHSNSVAAVVAMAVVMMFGAAVVPSAHADSGMDLYTRCIQSHPGIPPRESADDWIVTVRTIQTGLNSALSPAEVAQRLVGDGVKPNDAAVEVQCVLAVW
jgi:hypothetical protein